MTIASKASFTGSTVTEGQFKAALETLLDAINSPTADTLALFTAAAERFRITSSGNILIGTSTDNGSGSKLQVSGNVSADVFKSGGGFTVNTTSGAQQLFIPNATGHYLLIAHDSSNASTRSAAISCGRFVSEIMDSASVFTWSDDGTYITVNAGARTVVVSVIRLN